MKELKILPKEYVKKIREERERLRRRQRRGHAPS